MAAKQIEMNRRSASDGAYNEYCDAYGPDRECLLLQAERFRNFNSTYCNASEMDEYNEKQQVLVLKHVWHIFWTIVPTLFCIAFARLVAQFCPRTAHSDSALRFLLEYALIVLPTVVSVNLANGLVEYFVCIMCMVSLVLVWRTRCLQKARDRIFTLGRRPKMLTLARATINYLTALCILAIDFESFPREFRKTRRFGAGLMDVGIGLFVFAMGTVSRRPRRANDLSRLMRVVAPVLLLGFARTVVIMVIDYHQDEHEYGVHLNAFFTLGLTKLFGTLLSAVATSDEQLLPLGLVTMVVHEIIMQMGLSEFVMDKAMQRTTFWTANREGLCSLPGFVALYILSTYVGNWLQMKETLRFDEFKTKLVSMTLVSGLLWLIVVVSIFTVCIARVTCNFGYIAWILAIGVSMTTLFMLVFDLILNTLWPVDVVAGAGVGDCKLLTLKNDAVLNDQDTLSIPSLVEAINFNGLTFFMVANVLTGGVNIFFKPEDRSDFEGVLILSTYMLLATGVVYILYRFKIRIG